MAKAYESMALPPATLPVSFDGPYADTSVNVIAPHVDRRFYLQAHPDVARAGLDPAVHYADFGWHEGRNPNGWFDTKYYLSANPDVRDAGINPFWHYLVAGQHEGRRVKEPANFRRGLLRDIMPPAARAAHDVLPPNARRIDADALLSVLEGALETACGLVVSVSHDRYIDNVGGTQILIADEEHKFVGSRFVYCHFSPAIARLTLAPPEQPPHLQIVLNGVFIGATTYAAAAEALRRIPAGQPRGRLFVLHSLLGHDVDGLIAVARALNPSHSFFWVHDFFSVCEGFNLLRNDIAYCAAPATASMACRICIYGAARDMHLARVRHLFEQIEFHIVAPSATALDVWLKAGSLPHLDARVHEHCRIRALSVPSAPISKDTVGGAARIAFIGQQRFHKGHHIFVDIVARNRDSVAYEFYHFGSPGCLVATSGVTNVAVSVTPGNPHAMTNALRRHDIDLVLVLSPWPETFSYVTFEALAAGADVIALSDGGNVPRVVRSLKRGVVVRDEEALYNLFSEKQISAYVMQQRLAGKCYGTLEFCGTTATIDPGKEPADTDEAAGPSSHPSLTYDPAMRVAAVGRMIEPADIGNDTYRFQLRADCVSVRLVSRSVIPAWTGESATDARRIGVAVSSVRLDGLVLSLNDARLVGGWYQPESHLRWTDGNATVMTGGARTLEVTIRPTVACWRTGIYESDPGIEQPAPVTSASAMPVRLTPVGQTGASLVTITSDTGSTNISPGVSDKGARGPNGIVRIRSRLRGSTSERAG